MTKKFLGGLSLSNFMDKTEEWHALIEGFCDGFFPFGHRYEPSKALKTDIEGEHHYYRPGVVLGVVVAVFFWLFIYRLVRYGI